MIGWKSRQTNDGKSYNILNSRDLIQARKYAESLLRADFRRDFAFCALTNLTHTVFVAAKYVKRVITSLHSLVNQDQPSGVSNLVLFLATDTRSFFRADAVPFPLSVTPIRLLGRGGSASAIGVSPIVGLITSSDAVLQAADVHSYIPINFEFYPADDAVAFIKMCLQSRFLDKAFHITPPNGVEALECWSVVYEDAPEVHAILETINANRTTLAGGNLVIRAQNAIGQLEPGSSFRLKSVTRR